MKLTSSATLSCVQLVANVPLIRFPVQLPAGEFSSLHNERMSM